MAQPNHLPSPFSEVDVLDSSVSSSNNDSHGPDPTLTPRPYLSYSFEEHLSTLHTIKADIFKEEDAILALPKRRNKSQRPLALRLSKELWPELTEIAGIIKYDRLTTYAKAIVRQRRAELLHASLRRKNVIKIQGPWQGQDLDPVDLKGPAAIPMPVTIGTIEDFKPVFNFLAENKPIAEADETQGTHGIELLWKTPFVEFERGLVYEDGRLDLCKKVVGPTHIGKLMDSLESNHQIDHFLLGNNAISTTGAKCIAKFIEKHPDRMETWYLAGCHITRHGLSILVPQMIKSSKINNLWFKRNPFGPNSSAALAKLVLGTANLRTLDLENTELGDESVRQFMDGICGERSALKHLYLNANGIGKKGCVGLANYLADPHCVLESLFISGNPLGDDGIKLLASGLKENKTLKRLMVGSAGLSSDGVSSLANAIADSNLPIHTVDFGATQTTKVHSQKFNYLDDGCIEALKKLILMPTMRFLSLGPNVFTADGLHEIRSASAKSELVYLLVQRIGSGAASSDNHGLIEVYEVAPAVKSCSLEVRNRLAKNQTKYYPHIESYEDFLRSEDIRFLRNTSDVRQIDSMYRTMDKRLGVPMNAVWEKDDPTWKLISDDAIVAEREALTV